MLTLFILPHFKSGNVKFQTHMKILLAVSEKRALQCLLPSKDTIENEKVDADSIYGTCNEKTVLK